MDELRSALRQHRFAFLYENVEMDAEAAKVSSDALGVSPVFVCPSDFAWVSRPRLWWLSVEWARVVTDPADGFGVGEERALGPPTPVSFVGGPGAQADALCHDTGPY